MARLTKIELEQRLDAALKDAEQLRIALAVAEGNVRAYREHGNKLEDELRATKRLADEALGLKPGTFTAPVAELSPYRQALAKAREVAMRTGKCVRVG